jgi:isopenicillin N synthase-like dioxygenase
MTTAHATGHMILSILEAKLHLPPSALTNLHRIAAPSGDHVRFTRSPPLSSELAMEKQHATPAHTDFGSVTILLNWLGGLQIWTPETRGDIDRGQWAYVQPLPGHAIVNLGDAMVKFTNGILNSGRHRVLPAPGEQGKLIRYSIVYFVRPEDDVHLRVLDSPGIPEGDPNEETFTAKEWIIKKARSIGVKIGEDD